VAHGLAPTAATSSSTSLALVAGIGIPGALAVLGAAGFLATRRRRASR
jgi:LPXTG-motif cell wall-anchored protein